MRLRRQIAPLYALLCLSACSLAFTHRNVAPELLSLAAPAILLTVCFARTVSWKLRTKRREITPDVARAILRRTTIFASVISAAFVSWAIALDQYGGPYEHGHVAMFLSVTVLGCIFCLGYHPKAALFAYLIDVGAFFAYYTSIGSEVLVAIIVNLALAGGVVLMVLRESFEAFVNLEVSQRALERKSAEAHKLSEENALLAQTDALTGLPNRRYFFHQLEALLGQGDLPFAVGLIDLDGFKPVNDTYGHAQGDRLLRIIGERLKEHEDDSIVVTRLGGDEFGVIVKAGAGNALSVGQSLCALVRSPVQLEDAMVRVGCSMGISCHPEAGRNAHQLFDRADVALYHSKANRRGGCTLFSSDLADLDRSQRNTDSALQAADLDRELAVVYQPIFEAGTNSLVAVEALARWESPRLGPIKPDLLIAAAERAGLAQAATLTLFDKALAGAAKLPGHVGMAFNLSALDLANPETVSLLVERLNASPIHPSRITFELTEQFLIADLQAARKSLRSLKAAGVRLALDDFGTGFSSLSMLHQLPLDVVKVDRCFTARLHEEEGRNFVRGIRALAQTMSLKCVLEGIETETQLRVARATGFDYVQGYFLGTPGSIENITSITVAQPRAA